MTDRNTQKMTSLCEANREVMSIEKDDDPNFLTLAKSGFYNRLKKVPLKKHLPQKHSFR
jgi:hypothetical protein